MKKIQYMVFSLLTVFSLQGCSNTDENATADENEGTLIEGVSAVMEGMTASVSASSSRASSPIDGFSVNREGIDPTTPADNLKTRGTAGWLMDFNMYNNNVSSTTSYADGSFSKAEFSSDDVLWKPTDARLFPNYFSPQVEAWIYPNSKEPTSEVETNQSTSELLFAQDILHRSKAKMTIAHEPTITVHHKHAMLDFVIKDIAVTVEDGSVAKTEITEVTVTFNGQTYTPYAVHKTIETSGTTDLEYMVILPESTDNTVVKPVVNIKTEANTGGTVNVITYQQTIGINAALAENTCYCFTLQGTELKISPVTVINWTTGVSLPGEYIAVTAYPTFKAPSHTNETYYFYYDSEFGATIDGKFHPYLQEVAFNQNGECTLKADGRILTHILPESAIDKTMVSGKFTATDENMKEYELGTEDGLGIDNKAVTLGQMVIEIDDLVTASKR